MQIKPKITSISVTTLFPRRLTKIKINEHKREPDPENVWIRSRWHYIFFT